MGLTAQEMDGPYTEPLPYEDIEFPQWAHDIRRFEVIMFGSFPITFIMTSLVYDIVQSASGSGGSSVDMSQDDLKVVLISSASLSVGIALADLIIGKYKKKKSLEAEMGNGES